MPPSASTTETDVNHPATATAGETDRQDSVTALIKWYRIVAIAEAVSWGALLVAMAFKYVIADTEVGVRMIGPIHGTMFLAYAALTVVVARRLKWNVKVFILGLASAIPPFCTVIFERWADRSGHLDPGSTRS